jgi:hypothetical protein
MNSENTSQSDVVLENKLEVLKKKIFDTMLQFELEIRALEKEKYEKTTAIVNSYEKNHLSPINSVYYNEFIIDLNFNPNGDNEHLFINEHSEYSFTESDFENL